MLWGALGAVLRAFLQIVSQVILARLLGPEQFGLFALALVVVFFSAFFADVGLAYGLIQRKVVHDDDIRFVFTWQVVLGAVITVALFALAPWIASFYADQRLVPVVQWLSLTPLIGALGSTSSTLLRKDLNFESLNLRCGGQLRGRIPRRGDPDGIAGVRCRSVDRCLPGPGCGPGDVPDGRPASPETAAVLAAGRRATCCVSAARCSRPTWSTGS